MIRSSASGAAEWLSLAAAPTFAVMALSTAVADGQAMGSLCTAAGAWPADGMVLMYLLMAAFHVSPWLQRLGRPRR